MYVAPKDVIDEILIADYTELSWEVWRLRQAKAIVAIIAVAMTGLAWLANSARALLEGNTGPALSAAFSPDGPRVVTASEDSTARLDRLMVAAEAMDGQLRLAGRANRLSS